MKAYTYTIYKSGSKSITRTIAQPGDPAPKKQPKEYQTLAKQLQAEDWDMRDATDMGVRALNHAVEHAGMARGGTNGPES